MDQDISDFSIECPEDMNLVASTLQISSENHWPFLVPHTFIRANPTINFKYLLPSPYFQGGRQEDIEHEIRPIRSLSINFDAAEVPEISICKPPPWSKYLDTIISFFNDRPIWLKNTLIQMIPSSEKLPKNHLKHLLAWIAYSFENGPWRNTYVKLGYDPRQHPGSLVYQVIDFRAKEEGSVAKKPYDYSFSSLPSQQGQLYQLCDIASDKIKTILIDSDTISPECSVRFIQRSHGWLRPECFAEIKQHMKDLYLQYKLNN